MILGHGHEEILDLLGKFSGKRLMWKRYFLKYCASSNATEIKGLTTIPIFS
jgi:hypothetical protein